MCLLMEQTGMRPTDFMNKWPLGEDEAGRMHTINQVRQHICH
jgi:hypothetical protein